MTWYCTAILLSICDVLRKYFVQSRIIGGAETVPNEYPWIARLSHARFDQEHLCGGAVVSDRHVLTAAHCTDNM